VKTLQEHLRRLGKRGGKVKSPKKLRSAKANLVKARAARWPNKRNQS
jgi:hypothetical protein